MARNQKVAFEQTDPARAMAFGESRKGPVSRTIVMDNYQVVMNLDSILQTLEQQAYDKFGLPLPSKYDKYVSDSNADMLQNGVNIHVQFPWVKKHVRFRNAVAKHILATLNHVYANYPVDDYLASRLDLDNISFLPTFAKDSKFGLYPSKESSQPLPDPAEMIKQMQVALNQSQKQYQQVAQQLQSVMGQLQSSQAQMNQVELEKGSIDNQLTYVNPEPESAKTDATASNIVKNKLDAEKLDLKRQEIEANKYIARINK